MTPALGESHRKNNFDFLRFMLALVVIFAHSYDMLNRSKESPFFKFSLGSFDIGSQAVDGFFALSGFLIVQSFMNTRGVGNYLLKRVLRIYPGFIFAGLISLFFFGPIGAQFSLGYWGEIDRWPLVWRMFTLEPYWIPQSFNHPSNRWPFINSPPWTIQYEFVCYLMVIVLGVLPMLRYRFLTLTLFVVAAVFNVLNAHGITKIFYQPDFYFLSSAYHYPRFFTYFLAGTCCYLYRDVIPFKFRIAIPLTLVAVAFGTITRMMFGANTFYIEAILPISLPYLLFTIAFSKRVHFQNWAKFGDFSYGMYLYAWPVQQVLIFWSNGKIWPTALFGLASIITLMFAVGSWYGVERPFLRLKPKKKAVADEPLAALPVETAPVAISG